MSLQSEFARIAATDGRAALVTVISGAELGAKLLVRADGSSEGTLGSDELTARASPRLRSCSGRSARRPVSVARPCCSWTWSRRPRGLSCLERWTTPRRSAALLAPLGRSYVRPALAVRHARAVS